MHALLFEGTTYNFASWVYPIDENQGVGGSAMRIGTDDIIRRVDFADRGRFDYSYMQMLLAYGRNFGEPFSSGVALKIVHQSLDNSSDFGVGVDAGLSAQLYKNIRFGLAVRDILQPELKLVQLPEKTPISLVGGLALNDLALSTFTRLSASFDIEKHEDRDPRIHTGAELSLHDRFALRLGYDRDNLAFGAGLEHGRLLFDYAYKLVDYVDDTHRFSVTFRIGKSMTERIRERELALLPPEPTEEEKRFAALSETANQFFRRFMLDSAKVYFQQALDMRPDDEEIIGTLAAIEESRRVQEQQEAALRAAREDVAQTLSSFVAQAEQLLDRKVYQAGLDLLELIFDIDPFNGPALVLRNRILAARATEIQANMEAAEIAASESRWVAAVEAYNRVLELEPTNQAARLAKQRVLATMDLPERLRLGIEMFDRGNLVEARRRFEAILEVNPNEAVAMEYLRRISEMPAATEKPPATLEDLQRDRAHWELYLDGLRHMRNKEYQKAIEAWEKVLQAYPDNENTLNNIEQARLRLGTQESER
jgi:tetratricopeptide (TPR) repeat protein